MKEEFARFRGQDSAWNRSVYEAERLVVLRKQLFRPVKRSATGQTRRKEDEEVESFACIAWPSPGRGKARWRAKRIAEPKSLSIQQLVDLVKFGGGD